MFEHNAHQVEQAEELSKKMGFAKFDINGGHTFTAMNSGNNKAIEKFKTTNGNKSPANKIRYKQTR